MSAYSIHYTEPEPSEHDIIVVPKSTGFLAECNNIHCGYVDGPYPTVEEASEEGAFHVSYQNEVKVTI